MSLYIDVKHLQFISSRLENFKNKGNNLYNCRCPLCGDSKRNRRKSRGYFYRVKNDIMFKCHNCSASMHFGTFLKSFDPSLYKEYVFERYSSGHGGRKPHVTPDFEFETPVFPSKEIRLIDQLMERLDTCDENNEAVQYALSRGIPREKFSQLYYIDNIKNVEQLSDKYLDRITTEEPRLALPFFNRDGKLIALSLRALRGEALRYVTVKIDEDAPLVYGLDKVDPTQTIYAVEGPIDSLFLNNAIACAGTSFKKIETLDLPKDKLVVIFDNQPKNTEICKLMLHYIKADLRLCIWPDSVVEKDINEMIQAGRDVQAIIESNTFYAQTALMRFVQWKKC